MARVPKKLDEETRQDLSNRAEALKDLAKGVSTALASDLENTLYFLNWDDELREMIAKQLGHDIRTSLTKIIDVLFLASLTSGTGSFKPEFLEELEEETE